MVAVRHGTRTTQCGPQGECAEAQARLNEGLRPFWEIGERATVADLLENHARLAAERRQCEPALQLAGAAAALRSILRVPARTRDQAVQQPSLERTRQHVGDETFAVLFSAGQA